MQQGSSSVIISNGSY